MGQSPRGEILKTAEKSTESIHIQKKNAESKIIECKKSTKKQEKNSSKGQNHIKEEKQNRSIPCILSSNRTSHTRDLDG